MNEYPNFMRLHGATLIANGYSVLPIQPGTKAPGRYTNGYWSNYPNWSKHCDRATTDFEADIWATWPGCAIGLASGSVIGVDIDIMDDNIAWRVEELARLYLGDTPCKRIGLPPKRLLVYRATAPFPSRKTKPLEILAHGTQFIIHAIHPDTRSPYEWPDATLIETDISELPEVDEEMIETFYSEAWKIIPPGMKRGGHDPDSVPAKYAGAAGASLHGKRGTLPAVRAALEYVPNVDLDRADWIGVGMSIKGALGDEGFPLWIEWSRASNKSGKSGKTDTPERTWRSLKPHSRGAGSLYYRAMANGWCPPPGMILNGDLDSLPPVDLTAFMAKLTPTPEPEERAVAEAEAERINVGIPPDLLDVDGALKLFVDECNRTARRPQPFLALAAAICAVGVLAGRQYRSETNLRTNVYAVAVGESGSGKDNAPNVIRDTLMAAGLPEYLGGEDLASGRGIITAIAKHPCRLFQIDEFGLFLSEVTGRQAKAHQLAIKSNLMKLYSRAQSVYLGTEYADQKERERTDIYQPHACLYGATTPSTFWAALEGGALKDGFMARLLVFVTDNHRPPRNPTRAIIQPSKELTEACQDIAGGAAGADRKPGNLSDINGAPFRIKQVSSEQPEPYTVKMSREAASEHERWLDKEDALAVSVEGTDKASIVNRWGENAVRLAMIRAISRSPRAPEMLLADVTWGWRLAEHCMRTVLRDADRFIASNEVEANFKAIEDAIRQAGVGGIGLAALCRRFRRIRPRERDEIISSLEREGAIVKTHIIHQGGGRPGTKLIHLGSNPDSGGVSSEFFPVTQSAKNVA